LSLLLGAADELELPLLSGLLGAEDELELALLLGLLLSLGLGVGVASAGLDWRRMRNL